MKFGHIITLLALCCFGFASFAGCETPENTEAHGHDHDHGHDHGDHDHDHDHGDHSYDGVTITPTAGSDKTPFVLELDDDKSPEGKSLVYMLDDKTLMLAMSLGVEVEFTVGDDKFKGKIEPHAPHDH